MRFLLHGNLPAGAAEALASHEHVGHALAELPEPHAGTADLLAAVAKKQWNVLTNDGDFVQSIYDQKLDFNGCIVFILPDGEESRDAAAALARLFERYKRLSPRRLYTITPNRVKIRQLPGSR